VLGGRLSLEASDLSEFHTEARQEFGPMTVVLSSPLGHEVVNTSRAFGEPLPDNPDADAIKYVAANQQSRISDLTIDPITHQPAVTIDVPVARDSRLVYVLSLDISATLPRILNQLELPDSWIATVLDRRGRVIGRSRDPERFIGQSARPEFYARTQIASEGRAPGTSFEGVPVFTAFAHTSLGGWTVSSAIPRDLLLAPVQQTTLTMILVGGATVALAVGLAALIGRRIARPVEALVPIAEAVGKGEPAWLKLTPITEVNEVARSMVDAGERLRRAAAERETAIAKLADSERMYRDLAADLARVDEERNALLGRVVVAQESERRRIARDLHDDLAQHLTAIHLKLDAPRRPPAEGITPEEAAATTTEDLRASIGELGRAMDRMAWELRPVAIEGIGLRSAVEHYLAEWADLARMEVDLEINLDCEALPAAVETTLFRVLQEATTNVLRHAKATHVAVILEANVDAARLIVEDNGKGFLVNEGRPPFAAARGFGLLGMRERLALVRGILDVESAPDRGTTLFISIPLGRGPGVP